MTSASLRTWPMLLVFGLLLGAVSWACGVASETPATSRPLAPGPASATPPPLTGVPAEVTVAFENGFAPYVEPPPVFLPTPSSPPEIEKIANKEALDDLSEAQRDALEKNGFVVAPTPFATFIDLYAEAGAEGLPLFVTSDYLLTVTQAATELSWRRAKEQFLPDILRALTVSMVEASLAQQETARDAAFVEAARRNTAFFSIAARLLDADIAVDSSVDATVGEELTLIERGGMFISPLFGVTLDYSQFTSTAGAAPASSHERAMAWLANPFPLSGENQESLRRNARQVLLMDVALGDDQRRTQWERVYHPTAFFEGNAGWNLLQAKAVGNALYGEPLSIAALEATDEVDDFIVTMQQLPPAQATTFAPVPAISFMPIASSLTNNVADALVYNRVGNYVGDDKLAPLTATDTGVGRIRAVPHPLDLAAVIGSPAAAEHIADGADDAYDGYERQRTALASHYTALDGQRWTETYNGSWLFLTQPLLLDTDGRLGTEEAAQDRNLNTWFGNWVNLQLTSDLEAIPVTARQVPAEATAFVEPSPLFLGRLAASVAQVHGGLNGRGLLDDEMDAKLLRLHRLLIALAEIAKKELDGSSLSDDEELLLRQLPARLAALNTYSPQEGSGLSRSEGPLARLYTLDVGTTPGPPLQTALGEALPLFVIVPGDDQPLLALGGVYGTYYWREEGSALLAETWPAMDAAQRPDASPWLQHLIVP